MRTRATLTSHLAPIECLLALQLPLELCFAPLYLLTPSAVVVEISSLVQGCLEERVVVRLNLRILMLPYFNQIEFCMAYLLPLRCVITLIRLLVSVVFCLVLQLSDRTTRIVFNHWIEPGN